MEWRDKRGSVLMDFKPSKLIVLLEPPQGGTVRVAGVGGGQAGRRSSAPLTTT